MTVLKKFWRNLMSLWSGLDIEALKRENAELRSKVSHLESGKQYLSSRCADLEKQLSDDGIKRLRDENWRLCRINEQSSYEKAEAEWQNEVLVLLNNELRHRLQELVGIPISECKNTKEEVEAAIRHNDLIAYGSIDELELSVRAYNALRRKGINTISKLLDCTALELLNECRNFGKVSLTEVIMALAENGLHLREEEDWEDRAKVQAIVARNKGRF